MFWKKNTHAHSIKEKTGLSHGASIKALTSYWSSETGNKYPESERRCVGTIELVKVPWKASAGEIKGFKCDWIEMTKVCILLRKS